MQYLIHYTLILTLTVLGVSVFQWLKHERKYAIWVGLLFVLGLELGTRMFLTDNLGHNIALHAFDFTGIFIVMGTATVLALTSLIIWFHQKGDAVAHYHYPGWATSAGIAIPVVQFQCLHLRYSLTSSRNSISPPRI